MKNGKEPVYPDPMRGAEQSFVNQTPHDLPKGLTKREYFAGLAMQGLLTRVPQRQGGEVDLGILECERIAAESRIMADKLLQELEENKGGQDEAL